MRYVLILVFLVWTSLAAHQIPLPTLLSAAGTDLFSNSRFEEATKMFSNVAMLNATDAQAINNLATALYEFGSREIASSCFAHALLLDASIMSGNPAVQALVSDGYELSERL